MSLGRTLGALALPLVLALAATGARGVTPSGAKVERPEAGLLKAVRFDAWKRIIASQHGHVVVVDLWATWCAPCVERFPRMVKLARRYEQRGVRFLSLSLDDRSDLQALAWARKFLSTQRTPFPNYLLDEPLGSGFDRFGIQGIPAVFVYDQSGALRFRLTSDDPNDQVDEAKVETAILRLLGPAKSRTP